MKSSKVSSACVCSFIFFFIQ